MAVDFYTVAISNKLVLNLIELVKIKKKKFHITNIVQKQVESRQVENT